MVQYSFYHFIDHFTLSSKLTLENGPLIYDFPTVLKYGDFPSQSLTVYQMVDLFISETIFSARHLRIFDRDLNQPCLTTQKNHDMHPSYSIHFSSWMS